MIKTFWDIHPHDAENRGIVDGDMVMIQSRMGETVLEARITENIAAGCCLYHIPYARIGCEYNYDG